MDWQDAHRGSLAEFMPKLKCRRCHAPWFSTPARRLNGFGKLIHADGARDQAVAGDPARRAGKPELAGELKITADFRFQGRAGGHLDRKRTRLNSSHSSAHRLPHPP